MTNERLFIDTVFIESLINRKDQYHNQAVELFSRVRNAKEVWVTEAILIEVGNALSTVNRLSAFEFIEQCYKISNINVVPLTTELLKGALQLYHSRSDKTWGLCDCISFIVMWDNHLTTAVTANRHFSQAGFIILM